MDNERIWTRAILLYFALLAKSIVRQKRTKNAHIPLLCSEEYEVWSNDSCPVAYFGQHQWFAPGVPRRGMRIHGHDELPERIREILQFFGESTPGRKLVFSPGVAELVAYYASDIAYQLYPAYCELLFALEQYEIEFGTADIFEELSADYPSICQYLDILTDAERRVRILHGFFVGFSNIAGETPFEYKGKEYTYLLLVKEKEKMIPHAFSNGLSALSNYAESLGKECCIVNNSRRTAFYIVKKFGGKNL